jgi:hypothetical protein
MRMNDRYPYSYISTSIIELVVESTPLLIKYIAYHIIQTRIPNRSSYNEPFTKYDKYA